MINIVYPTNSLSIAIQHARHIGHFHRRGRRALRASCTTHIESDGRDVHTDTRLYLAALDFPSLGSESELITLFTNCLVNINKSMCQGFMAFYKSRRHPTGLFTVEL